MPIRYRYPGENWTTINASTYTLNKLEGQCYVGYDVYCNSDLVRSHSVYKNGANTWESIEPFPIEPMFSIARGYRIVSPPRITLRDNDYDFFTNAFEAYSQAEIDLASIDGTTATYQRSLYDLDRASGSYWIHRFRGNSISVKRIVPKSPEPLDCAARCVFEAFFNEQLVYQETRSVCPEVEETSMVTCPPNTCDVECGDTICCYNSEGISIFNYSK